MLVMMPSKEMTRRDIFMPIVIFDTLPYVIFSRGDKPPARLQQLLEVWPPGFSKHGFASPSENHIQIAMMFYLADRIDIRALL